MTEVSRKIEHILDDFARAARAAAVELARLIPESTTGIHATRRIGDVRTDLETRIYGTHYRPLAKKHRMLQICEENDVAAGGKMPWSDLAEFDHVLILDTLDATVNAFCGLPCGVNLAVGRIDRAADAFVVGDLAGVLVMDYRNFKTWRWSRSAGLAVQPARHAAGAFRKHADVPAPIYEIPDGHSYAGDAGSGAARQRRLLDVFREALPDHQRRAIDCTGLRLLEVADGNLAAYGDLRGAARVWDTLPSLRVLLEAPDLICLDGELRPYALDLPILTNRDGRLRREPVGASVIVARRSDADRILRRRDYLLRGGEA